MQVYRFHWLNGQGRVVRKHDFKLADDVSALESAAERCGDYSIDIFQTGRLVARLKKGNAELNTYDRRSL